MMKSTFLAMCLVVTAACAASDQFVFGSSVRVESVIHVSVDGLRGDFLRGLLNSAPARYPAFQRLRTEGAGTFNARCDFDFSLTVPNHVSMITGRPVNRPAGQSDTIPHGFTDNSPSTNAIIHGANTRLLYAASVFDVVHDHGLSTACLVSKAKLGLIDRSYDASHGAPDTILPDDGRRKIDFAISTDGETRGLVDLLVTHLGAQPEAYTFLHFYEPDAAGHAYGWGTPQWDAAVAAVDNRLARIFAAMDANPSLAGRIAMVLTADHGGGGGGDPMNQSDATRIGNVSIPFFIWAPGFPPGADIYPLLANRWDPAGSRPDYNAARQPLRNGDSGNLALALLGLPAVPGSTLRPAFIRFQPWPQIAHDSGGISVIWPAGFDRFVLESSRSLSNVEWQPFQVSPVATNGFLIQPVPLPLEPESLFFRLRKAAL
jgi:hypothetical protein